MIPLPLYIISEIADHEKLVAIFLFFSLLIPSVFSELYMHRESRKWIASYSPWPSLFLATCYLEKCCYFVLQRL